MQNEIRVKTTSVFKLRNKPGKNYQLVKLYNLFGFTPETVIVECVGKNEFVVRAVLTEEERKKELANEENIKRTMIK